MPDSETRLTPQEAIQAIEAAGLQCVSTRYPVVIHLQDANVVDRTACLHRVAHYVPAQAIERYGLCWTCEQKLPELVAAAREAAQREVA